MLGRAISSNSLILGAFAAVTAGLIAFTFTGTESRIQAAERAARQKALFEIVPQTRHNNDLLTDTLVLTQAQSELLGLKRQGQIHVAKHQGQPIAWIIPSTAPDGYSGAIKLIVGINIDGTIAGVRTLSHQETPGLGDKVDLGKSDWILGFNGKSLANPAPTHWKVKKDGGHFDAFTGATITPRAVVDRIKKTLEFYQAAKLKLIAEVQNSEAQP